MFTIFPRRDSCTARRGLCHTRDSGAVAIAPLLRRSAAFCFANPFDICCHVANSHCCQRRVELQMADDRHEWFLNQIFRHRAALYRYLRKFTSGAEDIEDLVQETYVRVYALSDYQAVDSPRALLFRIAHNMAVE